MSAHAEAIRASPRPPLYAYWHLLSLDAPTIAVTWCCAFAASAGVALPLYVPLALAIMTWMLYAADRLLDVRRGRQEHLRDRHWFHARHAAFLVCGIIAATVVLLFVAARNFPTDILRHELLVAGIVLVYLAAIHLPSRHIAVFGKMPLKEITVGIIFSFAVAIPALVRAPRISNLFVVVALFAVLCILNCLVIEIAERGLEEWHSAARWCERGLLALCAGSVVLAFLPMATQQQLLLLSIGLSSVTLFVVCRLHERISGLTFRIAADMALLTPIFFAPRLWLHP